MKITNKFAEVVLENTINPVLIITSDRKLFFSNHIADKLFSSGKTSGLSSIIDEIGLADVLETGRKIIDEQYIISSKTFLITKAPIVVEDEIKGAFAIFKDVTEVLEVNKKYHEHDMLITILNTVFDAINDWYVVVDNESKITTMSKAYKEFVHDDHAEGKHVTEVIENTRMHIVVQTGTAEYGDIQEIRGNKMIASRIPIKKNGEVVGAVGRVIFKDITDFYKLSNQIKVLEEEVNYYKRKINSERNSDITFDSIIGNSKTLNESKKLALSAARSDSTILITGESGTGKELFVTAIHNSSNRYMGPLVKVNCAAIPRELLESELFGYEDGAFTGAQKQGRIGKFEFANGGTIFLDEIGDMPMDMQVKILRVIQEKEIVRLGSNGTRKVDVRIIAATNHSLEELIKNKNFREDLYYRLNVFSVLLPPLRDRQDDVELLAEYLRKKISTRLSIYTEGFSGEATEFLKQYSWPGNIRELENVIERAVILLNKETVIRPSHLPKNIIKCSPSSAMYCGNKPLEKIISDIEKEIILARMQEFHNNKKKVAENLGLSRPCLYKKLSQYQINQ